MNAEGSGRSLGKGGHGDATERAGIRVWVWGLQSRKDPGDTHQPCLRGQAPRLHGSAQTHQVQLPSPISVVGAGSGLGRGQGTGAGGAVGLESQKILREPGQWGTRQQQSSKVATGDSPLL